MESNGFDQSVEEMMRADTIRASLIPGGRKTFYLIEDAWTMMEEPWRIRWHDSKLRHMCEVNLVALPHSGEKYAMFTTANTNGEVKNYVFLNDQYHYSGDEE